MKRRGGGGIGLSQSLFRVARPELVDVASINFKVMVTNADGSQTGKTMTQLGITETTLKTDAMLISFADGSQITEQTKFTMGYVGRHRVGNGGLIRWNWVEEGVLQASSLRLYARGGQGMFPKAFRIAREAKLRRTVQKPGAQCSADRKCIVRYTHPTFVLMEAF